jgi:hypothetical protein
MKYPRGNHTIFVISGTQHPFQKPDARKTGSDVGMN